jgi:hypothetical protein
LSELTHDLSREHALELIGHGNITNARLAHLIEAQERAHPDLWAYREPAATNIVKQATKRRTRLFGWHLANTGAAAVFVHFWDEAAYGDAQQAPSGVPPFFTLEAPIGVTAAYLPHAVLFKSGIAYAVTGAFGGTDGDASAPGAPLPLDLFIA